MSTTEERSAWLAGIRAMADFLEAHPGLPLPTRSQPAFLFGADAKAELGRIALELGTADKAVTDSFFSLVKSFGPITYEVSAYREYVCQRVVTGTKTITTEVPPAGVEMLTVTTEVDIVEWVCPPSILALATEDVA